MFSSPTTLVTIDGQPKLQPVGNAGVQRVVNTQFVILFDPAPNQYYIKTGDAWAAAESIGGPWRSSPPTRTVSAAALTLTANQPADGDTAATPAAPHPPSSILVATRPTELIVVNGGPHYTAIVEKALSYIDNSESNVFYEPSSNSHFVLLSGRWYQSASLEGPWSYVASDKLPAAFEQIPADSPRAAVRASIAGTSEADAARRDAQVPTVAPIVRTAEGPDVKYDGGQPQFQPVDNSTVSYAVNTGESVLRVQGASTAATRRSGMSLTWPTGNGPFRFPCRRSSTRCRRPAQSST